MRRISHAIRYIPLEAQCETDSAIIRRSPATVTEVEVAAIVEVEVAGAEVTSEGEVAATVIAVAAMIESGAASETAQTGGRSRVSAAIPMRTISSHTMRFCLFSQSKTAP
jgi:hypothetical protein